MTENTDRELLERAAKAAGIALDRPHIHAFGHGVITADGIHWSPLTDDGDALRLAVKLNMGISIPNWANNRIDVVCFTDCSINVIEENNNDPYAATRRAIVRAAAEIGRNMK